MINIVIPMAGAGSRFMNEGYKDPKPLIKVNGIPMIQVVINNLKPKEPHKFIFICQNAHVAEYGLEEKLRAWAPDCEVLAVDGLTEGAACTVMAAKRFIDNDDPLMIANSDQYIDFDIDIYLQDMNKRNLDGLIMTMRASDPKWSFVEMDSDSKVTRVVEKEVISDEATVGIYNFKSGSYFVHAAEIMIRENIRTNGEFYVAPTYNILISEGKDVGVFNIGEEGRGMYGLGIPSDLSLFLGLPVLHKATAVKV